MSDTGSTRMQTDQGDINAMLEKIRRLEDANKQLSGEKEAVLQEKTHLAQRLDQSSSKLSALTQKTQDEMMGKINTTISTWLESMGGLSVEKKEQVRSGLEQLAHATAEDSGLYQVICCASEQHIANVTQLEEIRRERDELQKRLEGGTFAEETTRVAKKRPHNVVDADQERPAGMWDDFKIMLQNDKGWCNSIQSSMPVVQSGSG